MVQLLKKGFAALVAALVGITAFAQVTTSSLNGKVTDANGAAVPGAAVVAVHTPSGTQYYAVANAEGRYAINGMRSGGPYKVEVSCLGYQSVTYTDVTLQLAEAYNLNAKLKDDTQMLSEAVVVSTANSKFAVEKTGAATNINNAQITALPTVSRSITDVTRLSPYGGNGMSSWELMAVLPTSPLTVPTSITTSVLAKNCPEAVLLSPLMPLRNFRWLSLHTMYARLTL